MEGPRQPNPPTGIGAAIGAVLGALFYCYVIAFEPGGFTADAALDLGLIMIVIGMALGASLVWLFSRLNRTR